VSQDGAQAGDLALELPLAGHHHQDIGNQDDPSGH
jgi:hypothetical protein